MFQQVRTSFLICALYEILKETRITLFYYNIPLMVAESPEAGPYSLIPNCCLGSSDADHYSLIIVVGSSEAGPYSLKIVV